MAHSMDTSINQIVAGSDFVKKIYGTRDYVLESSVPGNSPHPSQINISPIYETIKPFYKIVSVGSFLKSLLGEDEFRAISPHLPTAILEGIINATNSIYYTETKFSL